MKTRSFSELSRISNFTERFEYLSLRGHVGEATFGFDRWINQQFYRSTEWKRIRSFVIARDYGCDLGVPGHEIYGPLLVHHMNPMEVSDVVHSNEAILDPEYLITTMHDTHNAIHYGDQRLLPRPLAVRSAGDTRLW